MQEPNSLLEKWESFIYQKDKRNILKKCRVNKKS